MIVKVGVPVWELEESGRILSVGEAVSSWLTFHEADESPLRAEAVQVVQGTALSLPSWPGVALGRHPVQIDLVGGALYWEAPASVKGAVEVAGTLSTNTVDAPDDFPETTGVLRRIRMEWDGFVMGAEGTWHSTGSGPRYEEVSATYFPPVGPESLDPEAEADVKRRARQAYDREVSLGRLNAGDSFTFLARGRRHLAGALTGTAETRWTGVLIDLEISGPGRE